MDAEKTELMQILDVSGYASLEDYWKRGKGASKIRWGTPGDYMRCVHHIGKYVSDESAHRICAQWHKDVTGSWPGADKNK